ncbi:MAG: hypothetical protein NBV60_06095 [Erythrobacter sp.]|nr:hypothetical protein [Erythrobacter sp.]
MPVDLSGTWDGVFAYPDVPDAGPVTPFLAEITEQGGRISGTIIEPNEFRPATAHASLEGVHAGTSVDFLKTYHMAGEEYDEPVAYAGQVSDDGNVITGHWMMSDWSGPFEMVRQEGTQAIKQAQTAITIE